MDRAVTPGLSDLAALTSLGEPTRRRLYLLVVDAGRPVSRDEAAGALGISRSLAAYHLDRLTEHGLLDVAYARPPGRGGPGAGRPPKLYRRAARELRLEAPPRNYRLLAELLVRAVDQGGPTSAAIERTATELGQELAAQAGTFEEILRDRGYEPVLAEPGLLRLRNCPFDAVALRSPRVVCGINLALVRGILVGLDADPGRAFLAPQAGVCCVAVATASRSR